MAFRLCSLVLKQNLPANTLVLKRSFSTTLRRAQQGGKNVAVEIEKPVYDEETNYYKWVEEHLAWNASHANHTDKLEDIMYFIVIPLYAIYAIYKEYEELYVHYKEARRPFVAWKPLYATHDKPILINDGLHTPFHNPFWNAFADGYETDEEGKFIKPCYYCGHRRWFLQWFYDYKSARGE